MILDFPENRIRFIESLKNKYKIFLLSNTNKIHYDFYCNNFKNQYVYDFPDLFHKAYFSFKLGLKKPDTKIFQLVLDDNGLIPSETLFIDDTLIHINSASSMGINTIHLKDGEEIEDMLNGF